MTGLCSSAWGSVRLEVMRTSFSQCISIGWGVMHCDWFVQVQRLQAVPTLPLVQIMAFQARREGALTQLVRCLQVDGLVGICMCVCTWAVCPACAVADSVSSVYSVRVSPVVPVVIGPRCRS